MDQHGLHRPADDSSSDERLRSVLVTPYWPRYTQTVPSLPPGYYICSGCQRLFPDIRSKQAHKCRRSQ
ncbi:MAG: hypothetical protein AB7N91_26410 [Candidatus Tectimicrobiota bacterium]